MKICAGIVAFNPDIDRLKKNALLLKNQVDKIIIYDNGSKNLGQVEQMSKENDFVLLTCNKNIGIASALNKIFDWADKNGYYWVFTNDQDTIVNDNIIKQYSKYFKMEDVGIITCNILKRGVDNLDDVHTSNDYSFVDRCPTSGTMMNVDIWKKVGKYDDWLFIDYVDYDICKRVLLNNLKILKTNLTYFIQDLGNTKKNRLVYKIGDLLKNAKIKDFSLCYNHSSTRNYYYVRNSIYYRKKYCHSINLKTKKHELVSWELKKILLERHKIKTIKSLYKGYHDGKMKETSEYSIDK